MLGAIANTFANCFKIPELKSRIIFTVLLLGICRIMAWITIPGLDGGSLMRYFDAHAKDIGGSLLGMYSLFTGGAMQHCAVGSLGIMPYITATIIVQLLTAVVPQLSKLAREEGGRALVAAAAAGGDRRGHCRDPGATQDPCTIRAANGGPKTLRRAKLVHAAAGQLRRGDAHHFRAGHPDVSQQNLLYARQFEKHEVFRRDRAPVGPGASRLLPAVFPDDPVLLLLLGRDPVQ